MEITINIPASAMANPMGMALRDACADKSVITQADFFGITLRNVFVVSMEIYHDHGSDNAFCKIVMSTTGARQ